MGLTPEQVEIVKSTWETVAKAPEDAGEAILLRFLEKYPHNQTYFPFRNVPREKLKGSVMFRSHAGRVVAVFQKSVDAFNTADPVATLVETWTEIAKTHFKRNIKQKSFDELKEVVLEILTAACKLDGVQQTAWAVTLDTIFEIISKELVNLGTSSQ
ncbi:globin CTT-VI-like [Phlebotomus argentipes]|uniref:globin CTT-VI-like n=1 Tax=Phlebotomus argentipes TaxID=94469 RepID=UPI00289372AB|nr:globin CTT-VI-like [Phlebotomus argentipes]XP_059617849.1 globin CTT-VI-like [Phlebotomus argentipes]